MRSAGHTLRFMGLVCATALAATLHADHTPSQFTFTVLAGAARDYGSADGPGLTAARFRGPEGLAAGTGGRFIVADTGNHTIRAISATQQVTTIGGAAGVSGSTDGASADARFNLPAGVALHADGTVYVADTGNHTIRRITVGGVVSTIAGTAGALGSADGTGTAARFRFPSALVVAADHTLYVADTEKTRFVASLRQARSRRLSAASPT